MAVEVTNNGDFARAFKVSDGFVEVKPGETKAFEPLTPIGDIDGVLVKDAKPDKAASTAKAADKA